MGTKEWSEHEMSGKVEYASDVYPLWLRAADLEGRAVTVKIARVDVETFHGRDGGDHPALVLSFERARRRLILNRTQANALCRILRSERLADWIGKRITLAPGVAPNGKPTIVIREPTADSDSGLGQRIDSGLADREKKENGERR